MQNHTHVVTSCQVLPRSIRRRRTARNVVIAIIMAVTLYAAKQPILWLFDYHVVMMTAKVFIVTVGSISAFGSLVLIAAPFEAENMYFGRPESERKEAKKLLLTLVAIVVTSAVALLLL